MPEFGPAARDNDNRGANPGRLVNCYRQPVPGNGMTRYALKAVPGTEAFADTEGVFFRAVAGWRNQIFAAYGGTLYRVDEMGTSTDMGSLSDGLTSFSSNGDYLTIAANGTYYTLTGSTLAAVSGNAFTAIGSVGFQDQYTLLTERNGRRWAWSDLADPTTLPGLNFATAESSDDDLLRVVSVNGRVVLFKETGREIWFNTGQSGANAFKRVAGGVRSTGLKSYNLVTLTRDALFFIGNDNIARLTTDGFSTQMLSYPPVDTALAQSDPTDCFYYEAEGQKFCVIRFSDQPAWVLDLGTMEWHERAHSPDLDPWIARGSVQLGNAFYVATETGEVHKLTQNNADVGTELRRVAVSGVSYFPDRRSVDLIELYGRVGYSDLGRDAQVAIRLSRDGGDTWSEEKPRSMGDLGDHDQTMRWRSQGLARQLVIEANVTDPAELPLYSDYRLDAS
jgi:hypothetical protein